MAFSWGDLGLTTVWLETARGSILYNLERGCPVSDDDPHAVYPRLRYPDEDAWDSECLDLRLLARSLLPTLSQHHLPSVMGHYGVQDSASAPEELARLLRALLDDALHLDREIVALLAQMLPAPLSELLTRLVVLPMPEPRVPPTNAEDVNESPFAETASCDDALAPDGPIASAFSSFESRSGQLAMAREVEAAFRDGHAALIEAGPGTGKTFAYLIPALLHLRRNPADRLLVSTRTRQLQEQLYGKDLPFLMERLAPDLEVALLKGRENYLCYRRWQGLVAELTESLEQATLLPLLAPLVRWMAETPTGDIEENSAFLSNPEARSLWRRLCDSPFHCTGSFCPFMEDCFSVLARRRARRADLVVVNHSLLLADLTVDGVVLGKYTHLVVDEAHTLEPAARMAFTQQLTERSFLRLADDLSPVGRRRRGWLQRTTFAGGSKSVSRVEELLTRLRTQVGTVFRQIEQHLPEERRAPFDSLSALSEEIGETPILLTQLEDALDALSDAVDDEEARKELEGYVKIVQGLSATVSTLSSSPAENTVHWLEQSPHVLTCYATPLDVAPFLERMLYPNLKSLVMTSATLSLAGTFDFHCRSVGLSDEAFSLRTLIAESPFAYEDRMRILVPRYLPPAHGELIPYAEALAQLITSLSERHRKNGLVLFTSYAMLHAVKDCLPSGVATLVQGNLSRTALIERFRRADAPIWLLGTESFWEGVDFPGEELEILVIARLPFPVPTDPVLAAMGRRMRRDGRDPFMDLSVPLAGLKLRQGVGRLIRTHGDRGLVFLTDQRIVTKGYGKWLAASLPVNPEQVPAEDSLLDEADTWFGAPPSC